MAGGFYGVPGRLGGLALAAVVATGGDDILRCERVDPSPKKRRATPRASARRGYSHYAYLPAGVNRHTGKPHEHRRAIARATTAPGTPERAAAMAAARVPSK